MIVIQDLDDGSEVRSLVDVIDLDADSPIDIFLPGPVGKAGPQMSNLIDVGTRAEPVSILASIEAPLFRRQRCFIKGAGGPAFNPAISNPPDNLSWEICLFCTDDDNTITLESQENVQLSGQWIGVNGSILWLQWDGASKYVEDHRNEI